MQQSQRFSHMMITSTNLDWWMKACQTQQGWNYDIQYSSQKYFNIESLIICTFFNRSATDGACHDWNIVDPEKVFDVKLLPQLRLKWHLEIRKRAFSAFLARQTVTCSVDLFEFYFFKGWNTDPTLISFDAKKFNELFNSDFNQFPSPYCDF